MCPLFWHAQVVNACFAQRRNWAMSSILEKNICKKLSISCTKTQVQLVTYAYLQKIAFITINIFFFFAEQIVITCYCEAKGSSNRGHYHCPLCKFKPVVREHVFKIHREKVHGKKVLSNVHFLLLQLSINYCLHRSDCNRQKWYVYLIYCTLYTVHCLVFLLKKKKFCMMLVLS